MLCGWVTHMTPSCNRRSKARDITIDLRYHDMTRVRCSCVRRFGRRRTFSNALGDDVTSDAATSSSFRATALVQMPAPGPRPSIHDKPQVMRPGTALPPTFSTERRPPRTKTELMECAMRREYPPLLFLVYVRFVAAAGILKGANYGWRL